METLSPILKLSLKPKLKSKNQISKYIQNYCFEIKRIAANVCGLSLMGMGASVPVFIIIKRIFYY